MSSAAQIRAQVEAVLARRIPAALTPAQPSIRPKIATGIEQLDDLLEGGLPLGAISEIVGPEGSGRTSLALTLLARLTRQGKVCAWIDVSDTLHPESVASSGVDLERLLWVRCGRQAQVSPIRPADSRQTASTPQTTRVQLGGGSPHPRSESRGLPTAISNLLGVNASYKRNKIVGTPGAPNRSLISIAGSPIAAGKHSRDEQVAYDRMPARRGQYVLQQREAYEPRCAEPQHKPRPQNKTDKPFAAASNQRNGTPTGNSRAEEKPWTRLDQALRATDLLVQAGGFSAIVLDMGSIPPEFASRVPLATWFRYRAAVERAQSSFLLLTQHPCAKSSAGLALRLEPGRPIGEGATVFAGLANRAELVRQRFDKQGFEHKSDTVRPIRKPPQRANATEWRSATAWTVPR